MEKIIIGMSGGVDSSVAALLLKEQGCECAGVFMYNWEEKDDSGVCCAQEDYDDVRRVCDKIGIPYYTVNFVKEYYERVFSYFLKEYEAGRTPNPDILCNKEIKFKAFLNFARQLGADRLATGHYAQLEKRDGLSALLRAKDENKDQTYFLCALNQEQLSKSMFPIGGLLKSEVRELARKAGLCNQAKKDSTGICFIGERNFRQFLKNYIPAQEGEIRTLSGKYMGRHEGAMYYTLGQRHGLGIGSQQEDGRPWFVVDKDVKRNIIYVEQGEHPRLYSKSAFVSEFNWIMGQAPKKEFDCMARFRHRQSLRPVHITLLEQGVLIEYPQPERAVTPGQAAVLYMEDMCLGGGAVEYTSQTAAGGA